jgi:hypothetical protein
MASAPQTLARHGTSLLNSPWHLERVRFTLIYRPFQFIQARACENPLPPYSHSCENWAAAIELDHRGF